MRTLLASATPILLAVTLCPGGSDFPGLHAQSPAPGAQEKVSVRLPDGLPRLAPPVRIEAGGAPITVETGHAAPFVVDLDRDGKKDLVVGQFAKGVARIYLNHGSNAAPSFDHFVLLEADGKPASVKPG